MLLEEQRPSSKYFYYAMTWSFWDTCCDEGYASLGDDSPSGKTQTVEVDTHDPGDARRQAAG